MSYTKHNYKKGDELLASQLNDMDDQIALNEQTADTLVTVSNTQPSAAKNRVWVKATPSEIEIPTMEDMDEVSRHLSDLGESYNLISECITPGAIRYDNGLPATLSSAITNVYKYSRFIPVKAGTTIDYLLRTPTTYCVIAWYTSPDYATYDQTKSIEGTGGGKRGIFTAESDGYVVVTLRNDFVLARAILHHSGEIVDLIDANSYAITKTNERIFNLSDMATVDAAISNLGYTGNTDVRYGTTDFFPIKAGESFSYNIGHSTTYPIIAFYTTPSDAEYIDEKSIKGISGYLSGTYTADQDGYVRFCYLRSRSDSYVIFYPIPDNVKAYVTDYFRTNLRGMKILCLGDSIFGNDGEIVEDLSKLSGATVINGAFGGTRVTDRGGTDNFQYFDGLNLIPALVSGNWTAQDNAAAAMAAYSWVAERLAVLKSVDLSTVDLITMDYGSNDYTGGQTLAAIKAAYTTVIDTIRSVYPAIRILIITPMWRYFGEKTDDENGDNKIFATETLKDIASGIYSHALDKRVSALQMYQEMPLDYNTADLYFDSDSDVHLNATGNMVYSKILYGKIISLF